MHQHPRLALCCPAAHAPVHLIRPRRQLLPIQLVVLQGGHLGQVGQVRGQRAHLVSQAAQLLEPVAQILAQQAETVAQGGCRGEREGGYMQ